MLRKKLFLALFLALTVLTTMTSIIRAEDCPEGQTCDGGTPPESGGLAT